MILDVVLVLIVALGTFIGYKRGFVKVVIKLGIMIIAIILGLIFQGSVAEFIGDTMGLRNNITIAVENKLTKFTKSEDGKAENIDVEVPILSKTLNDINSAAEDKKAEIINKWASNITNFIIKGLSFIAIFIVTAITMGIISLILNTIVQLPVLNTLNGVFGAASEFILILFVISIILAIISFLSPLEILNIVTGYIEKSCITKWLYENNIIVYIIGKDLL